MSMSLLARDLLIVVLSVVLPLSIGYLCVWPELPEKKKHYHRLYTISATKFISFLGLQRTRAELRCADCAAVVTNVIAGHHSLCELREIEERT